MSNNNVQAMTADEFLRLHFIVWLVCGMLAIWAFVTMSIANTYIDEGVVIDKMFNERFTSYYKKMVMTFLYGCAIALTGPLCGLVISNVAKYAEHYLYVKRN